MGATCPGGPRGRLPFGPARVGFSYGAVSIARALRDISQAVSSCVLQLTVFVSLAHSPLALVRHRPYTWYEMSSL